MLYLGGFSYSSPLSSVRRTSKVCAILPQGVRPRAFTKGDKDMKDTAPKELGIIAVAALFGLVALLVAYLVLKFAGFASFVIGAIVAIITAIVLWLGWREPAAGPTGPRDLNPNAADTDTSASAPAASATTSSATAAAPAAAFAATATAAPATAEAAPAAAAPTAKAAKPAAKAAKPAAKTAKPAAKTAKPAAKAAKPAAKADKPAAKAAKPAAAKAARAPVAADGKPETLTKARAGGADDLKQLKGVGPGLEKTLNELGFFHFDQIGAWRKKEVEWVDSRLKFKGRIERDEWIKQAKVLAKGGTTEFAKKVKKGGVY